MLKLASRELAHFKHNLERLCTKRRREKRGGFSATDAALSPAEMKQLEDFLHARRTQAKEAHLREFHRLNGVHPLLRRNNVVITNEMTNQLRDEENI